MTYAIKKTINNSAIKGGRRLSKLFLMSPSGICLFAFLPLIAAYSIPANFYEFHIREPYLVARSPLTLLFYTVCIMSLFIGSRISSSGSQPRLADFVGAIAPAKYVGFMLAVLTLMITLNLYSLSIIIRNSPQLVSLILEGNGSAIKNETDTSGALTQAQPMLIAILTWFAFRFLQVKKTLSRLWSRTLVTMLIVGIAVSAGLSTIKLARYELMPLLIQMFIVFGTYTLLARSRSAVRFLTYLAVAAAAITAIFVGFTYLRSSEANTASIAPILGYTLASFNRLASLVDGSLVYSYGGTGIYAVPFLSHIPLVHNVVDVAELTNMPEIDVAFHQEFIDIGSSGLDPKYIWPTAPGYFYADFGFLSVPLIFCIGVIWRQSWESFIAGRTSGIMLYPFLATSIVMWFTANWAMRPALVTCLVTAFGLSFVERLLFGRRPFERAPRAQDVWGKRL